MDIRWKDEAVHFADSKDSEVMPPVANQWWYPCGAIARPVFGRGGRRKRNRRTRPMTRLQRYLALGKLDRLIECMDGLVIDRVKSK